MEQNWQSLIKPLMKAGKTHGDTFMCDDFKKIQNDFKDSVP